MTTAPNGLANAIPYRWTYADATERQAASGFATGDLNALSLQLDDHSLWILTDVATRHWVQVAGGGGGVLPDNIVLFPFQFARGAGQGNVGIYYWNTRGDMPFNFVNVPDGIDEGHTFTASFLLAPGSYNFAVLGMKDVGFGTVKWTLDGVDVIASQDWYAAATETNVRTSDAVTVAGVGLHTLRWTMITRNAASSDNIFSFSAFWFTPA